MGSKKCIHKGCGKVYTDTAEPCVYHPGPPEFHEGQKGWKCCKPRVLTFDEFLEIPPCTTGTHSDVDDSPAPPPKKIEEEPLPTRKPIQAAAQPPPPQASAQPTATPAPAPPPPESEDDEPGLEIPVGKTCRRRTCGHKYTGGSREGEKCVHHPGHPLFHEGSKGWTCCKRRVLEFDEFMKIEGCETKDRHMFVGSGKVKPETLETVRNDYYQTATTVIASLYLKKIDKSTSVIEFTNPTTIKLDLKTQDNKRFKTEFPLYGPIDTEKSTFRVGVAKLEFNLVKADDRSWATLRSDEKASGIYQVGKAGRA